MATEAYQITAVKSEQEVGMIFNFWGSVTLLRQEESGRVFSKYYIKSKETPIAPSGWSFEAYQFPQAKKISVKKGGSIFNVTDELGNVYYEVTSIV